MNLKEIATAACKPFGINAMLPKAERVKNLKSNCFLVISAMAFYCLSSPGKSKTYALGLFATFFALVLTGSQFANLFRTANSEPIFVRLLSALGAIGISENGIEQFYKIWSQARLLKRLFGSKLDICLYSTAVFGALCALPFLYVALALFYRLLRQKSGGLSLAKIRSSTPKWELCVYAVLLALSFIFVIALYGKTTAFYAPAEELSDFIYTSDTRLIASPNAYLTLANGENDLRQPLFAVFSAPFIAAPYAISLPFRFFFPYASLYCMEAVQILLIFLSVVLLGRLVSQNPMCRAAFVFVFCCSYPYLLFSLVMEQYVFAFFYLVIFLYAVCSHGKKDKLLFFGATGTLTTSVIFAPLLIENTKFKNWKKWLFDLFCLGIGYVFVMLLFCRGDLILRLVSELRLYKNFTGQSVAFFTRCMQYTSFIASCFTAPLARPTKYILPSTGEVLETFSWQLAPVEAWNIAGIVIFCLCVAGFIVNQKSLLARISFAWILFSTFILCLLGWGTKENGLVLYSLYFGWAFAVLLFLLATRIAKLTRIAILPAILSLSFGAVLIRANSAGIQELVQFAAEFCPR